LGAGRHQSIWSSPIESQPVRFGASIPLTAAIGFPLVFLVLAEAFRQGEKLHHDVEGLV
jgi:hypothetical protein